MALPPLTHQLATKILTEFCARRTPPEVQAKVRVGFEIRGDAITISEHRPAWDDPTEQTAMKIADRRAGLRRRVPGVGAVRIRPQLAADAVRR